MNLNISISDTVELKPRIVVFGVGGAGGNAVNNMIAQSLEGVDFVAANTDAQALALSSAEKKVQIGRAITQGLGAGARPEIGRAAAEESLQEIYDHLQGCHMCFIAAGMGGGTGTGAAPVIARIAKEQDILTVGVVTKPFHFEGNRRMALAEAGIEELQQFVDTLIIIPNQNLFRIAGPQTTFVQAFSMADEVLHSGVRGITDLMVMPGLINLDFADVRSVMSEMGKAMMGTGEAEGEDRAREAAERAISNPLLDDVSMKGARGVLINITGGMDLTLMEVDEAANRIRSEVDPDANIIVGSTLSDSMNGTMRVSIVATGIDAEAVVHADPRESVRAPVAATSRAAPPADRQRAGLPPFKAETHAPVTAPAMKAPPPAVPAVAESLVDEDVPEIDGIEEDLPEVAASVRDVIAEAAEARRDKAFIAPAAARAPAQPRTSQPVNAPEKTPSFIERMTNASSWLRRDQVAPDAPRPAAAAPAVTPKAPPPAPATPALREESEPALKGNAQDRLFGSADEDQLEIPAFLRRQAN